jgi:dTDP-4-dehydrorhamnose reductase
MLRLAAERDELRVVADQIGAPTPARWIAQTTAAAVAAWPAQDGAARRGLQGTYHLVAGGTASWFDFAGTILREAQARGLLARVPRMVPIATADYPTKAARPAYSVLDTGRLAAAFGLQCPDWHDGLRAVLDELAAQPVPTRPSP